MDWTVVYLSYYFEVPNNFYAFEHSSQCFYCFIFLKVIFCPKKKKCSGMSVDAEGFSGMCVQSLVMKVGQKCFPSVWLLILHKLTRLIKI